MGDDPATMHVDSEIDKQLREIFREVFGLDEISDETSPKTVPHWDSLRHIELIMAIECVTGKVFSPLRAMELKSVGEIRRALHE